MDELHNNLIIYALGTIFLFIIANLITAVVNGFVGRFFRDKKDRRIPSGSEYKMIEHLANIDSQINSIHGLLSNGLSQSIDDMKDVINKCRHVNRIFKDE